MKQATRERLNALNLRFYGERAQDFSATRARPWAGSAHALAIAAAALPNAAAPPAGPLRVLDVGCGNGRLVVALRDTVGERFAYTGIDASESLLAIARARQPAPNVQLARSDFIACHPEAVLPPGPFDLVALLGVLHHVPGADQRIALLRAAAARLAASGVLAFSLWRFDRSARLARRLLPARERVGLLGELAIDERELEPGDQLLRWGLDGVRYCHLHDDAECERLATCTQLAPLARFRADGEGDQLNEYVLLHAG